MFQKYEVEFLLQQQWYDPRLRYANQSRYEFLNAIHHHEDIWLPDTYFIMHGDFKGNNVLSPKEVTLFCDTSFTPYTYFIAE